jgi:hypothetical protein
METSAFRAKHLLRVIILSCILLAGFPGQGVSVQLLDPPLYVPKAFRQLEASVVGLRFFATPTPKAIPMQARAYSTSFFKAKTRYIWWEMCLDLKAKWDRPVTLYVWATWQRPDGTEFNQSIAFTIPPGFQKPCLAAWSQDKKPGGWVPGSYCVAIQIDDIQVASGSFEVFQKFLEGE